MRLFRWSQKYIIRPVTETFTHFGNDDGYLLAAGVAYYVGLSFFPLLWVLIQGLNSFFQFTNLGPWAEAYVLRYIEFNVSVEAKDQAFDVFKAFQKGTPSAGLGPVSIGVLLFTAGTIFAQFERAFDRIWKFTPPEDMGWIATLQSLLFERITAFLLMIGVGILVVATFIAATTLQKFYALVDPYLVLPPVVRSGSQFLVAIVLNTLAFGVLYHTMPRARVRWKEAFRGGLVVAVVWEVGRLVLVEFLIGERYTAYGVVGALIAIQLWAWYAVTVILLGAEYVRVTCAHRVDHTSLEWRRRRFWQLMSRMTANRRTPSGDPATISATKPPGDAEEAGEGTPEPHVREN